MSKAQRAAAALAPLPNANTPPTGGVPVPLDHPPVKPVRDKNAPVKLATLELQTEAIRLRRAGMTVAAIGALLEITPGRVSQLLVDATKDAVMAAGEAAVSDELAHLERLRTRCWAMLDNKYFLVSAGVVVRDEIEDADGAPIIDPRSGRPMTARLEDHAAVLAIVDRIVKIGEAIARLVGLNAPKRSEISTRDSGRGPTVVFANGDEMQACLQEALRGLSGPRTALPSNNVVSEQ
jgi:hypothetical protein